MSYGAQARRKPDSVSGLGKVRLRALAIATPATVTGGALKLWRSC